MPACHHPLPKAYTYGFFQLLWTPLALGQILLLSKWMASFTLTSVRKTLWRYSLHQLVFVAAHPPGGQREGDFCLRGHLLPWHTNSSSFKRVKSLTLNTGTHLLSGDSNLRTPMIFLPVSPHSLVPKHLEFFKDRNSKPRMFLQGLFPDQLPNPVHIIALQKVVPAQPHFGVGHRE